MANSLAHGEARSSAIEVVGGLSVIVDSDGDVLQCSDAWADFLHLSAAKVIGRPFLDLVDPTDRELCEHGLKRTLAGHPAEEFNARFPGNGRGPMWVALQPRLCADRRTVYLAAHDISAHTARASEPPTAEILLESIEEGIAVLDATRPGLPIVQTNASFTRLTGYSAPESINRSFAFLVGHSTDVTEFQQAIESAVAGRRASTEICLHGKNSLRAWVRLGLRPLCGTDGVVRQIVAAMVDISERRVVLEALRDKNAALTEALESLQKTKDVIIQRERMHALGKMASGIVHDFNNLLAPILGFSELLLTIPELLGDPDKVVMYLQRIRTAANDGAAVVARLREFYRSRNDAEPPCEFSLQKATEEVLELTRHRWRSEAEGRGKNYELVVDLQETKPLYGTAVEIRQALTNLFLNAFDAMPDGGTLSLRTYPVGNWVCMQIADTGVGMSDDVRRRCFEPLFTTKGKAGTGLGLTIVFGVIERHGGRVDVQSEPGHGTTFTLWLPAGTPPKDARSAPAVAATAPSVEGEAMRVLAIDDEDLLLEVVSLNLSNMGHTVDCFTDPKAALEQFYKKPYDLVITDRAMPGMSGDQVAKLIREFKPKTPIVLLTGFANIIRDTGEKPANIDAVLSKPLSQHTLCQMMARFGGRSTIGAAGLK